MKQPRYSKEEIAQRAQALYNERIRPLVEQEHLGKYLVIDIDSGDYEIDTDHFAASKRLHDKHPEGARFGMKIGQTSMGRIGYSLQVNA